MKIKNFIYSLCLCLCLAGTSVYAASAGQGKKNDTTAVTENKGAIPEEFKEKSVDDEAGKKGSESEAGENAKKNKDNKEKSSFGLLDFIFWIIVIILLIAVVVALFKVFKLQSQQDKFSKKIKDIAPQNAATGQTDKKITPQILYNRIQGLEQKVEKLEAQLERLQNQPGANQTSSRTSATAGTSAAAGTVGMTAGAGAASNAASANRYTDDDVNNLFVDAPKQAAPKRDPKNYYFESVDDNMYFCGMSETRTGNSVYQLTTIDGVRGDFVVLQGTTAMAAFNATIDLVRNACDYDESLESATNVETEDEGKAVLAGGRWKVSTRAKIKIS